MSARSLLALACALFAPVLAHAQTVRGTVTSGDTLLGAPVPGVVVLLVDAGGATVARDLTDERGAYRLSTIAAGAYRVRTLRIGFRPATSPPLLLGAGHEIEHRVALDDVRVTLDTVRVVGRSSCGMSGREGGSAFAVWEQVRTALTATQLTQRMRYITAAVVTYRQTLDPASRRVREHSSTLSAGLTAGPWGSISADSLRRSGYVHTELDGSTTYFAPDLDVLLSDTFIEDHCFRIVPGAEPGLFGIEFEPGRERRRVPEIRGVVRLDAATTELRAMDFAYVNLTAEQESAAPGGQMRFIRMANGAWMISSWSIRMPVIERGVFAFRGRMMRQSRIVAIHVAGGDLALAMRGADTLWAGKPLALAGIVRDSASRRGLAGARVSLRGTTLSAATGAGGRFAIGGLQPGYYTLEVRTASLDSANAVHEMPVSFVDSADVVSVAVPTLAQLAPSLCPGASSGTGIVAGAVSLRADGGGGGAPAANARVVAEWTEAAPAGDGTAPGARRSRWIEERADARGAFRLCGAPAGTALTLRAEGDSGVAAPRTVVIPAAAAGGTAALARADLVLERAAARPAVLAGVVLSDVNGQPLPDVEVALTGLARSAFTDERGAFRFSEVSPGTRVVSVRRVGFQPLSLTIVFAAGQRVERSLLLSRVAVLDTVAVSASAYLRDFEEHRQMGLGHFVTRADLARQEGRRLSEIMSQVRGVHISAGQTGNAAYLSTSRGSRSFTGKCPEFEGAAPISTCACFAQVYVDHALIYGGRAGEIVPDLNRIIVQGVEAIEYYAGPAQTPLKYSRLDSNCGVLVIHTRRTP